MIETLVFILSAVPALFAGYGLLKLIDRGWKFEEKLSFDRERADDLAAVQLDPGRYKLNTPAGVLFVGPAGRVFRKFDVYPPEPEKPKGIRARLAELRR